MTLQEDFGQQAAARGQLSLLQSIITLASFSFVVATIGLILYSNSRFGASGLETGALVSVGELMSALPRPLLGAVLDKYGRKHILVAGIGLIALAMAVFAVAESVTLLLIARTLHGFGIGTMLMASYTMTADLAHDTGRAGSFGSTEQAQYRGGLIGGFLAVPILIFTGFDPKGNLLITQQAWMMIFGLYAVVGVVAMAVAITRLQDTHAAAMQRAEEEDHQRINPQLYVLMAIVLITSTSVSGIGPFVMRFIQDHITQNLALLALAYLPASIVWAALPARLGRVADRFGRKPPMVVGLTVSGLFSAIIPLLTSALPLMLFATIEALCYSAAVPAEQAMVADMTGGKKRGTGFGLYTFAQSAGKVIGPLIMGWMYDRAPTGPFITNFVILVLGGLLVWFVLKDPAGRGSVRRMPPAA